MTLRMLMAALCSLIVMRCGASQGAGCGSNVGPLRQAPVCVGEQITPEEAIHRKCKSPDAGSPRLWACGHGEATFLFTVIEGKVTEVRVYYIEAADAVKSRFEQVLAQCNAALGLPSSASGTSATWTSGELQTRLWQAPVKTGTAVTLGVRDCRSHDCGSAARWTDLKH